MECTAELFQVIKKFSRVPVLTKCVLVSEIAKTYDVLGWFAPSIVQVKILLNEISLNPSTIQASWVRWKRELPILTKVHIARCYFPQDVNIVSTKLRVTWIL